MCGGKLVHNKEGAHSRREPRRHFECMSKVGCHAKTHTISHTPRENQNNDTLPDPLVADSHRSERPVEHHPRVPWH